MIGCNNTTSVIIERINEYCLVIILALSTNTFTIKKLLTLEPDLNLNLASDSQWVKAVFLHQVESLLMGRI